jgi:hypothetical protein
MIRLTQGICVTAALLAHRTLTSAGFRENLVAGATDQVAARTVARRQSRVA